MIYKILCYLGIVSFLIISCNKEDDTSSSSSIVYDAEAVGAYFQGRIDLNNMPDYANQSIPNYINEDNVTNNRVTDIGATLGRVLFYDKKLSVDNTVSCASCHQQEFAFSDTAIVSSGVAGTTGRHAMRLINTRFSEEEKFFWDERASTLEEQTTMPIHDQVEMGFSGENGNPSIDSLFTKLQTEEYYNELFTYAFGDSIVTEERMQNAMAQFIRSIQSFDSKYDIGRASARSNRDNFSNFTTQENLGKALFFDRDGAGCGGCHGGDEFDIRENSGNNGVVTVAGSSSEDYTVTRAPSLRDLINNNDELNGSMMHDGSFASIEDVLNHYNDIDNSTSNSASNTNLDSRLNGQVLDLSSDDKDAIEAFLKTLTGSNVYTNDKWSDPF